MKKKKKIVFRISSAVYSPKSSGISYVSEDSYNVDKNIYNSTVCICLDKLEV